MAGFLPLCNNSRITKIKTLTEEGLEDFNGLDGFNTLHHVTKFAKIVMFLTEEGSKGFEGLFCTPTQLQLIEINCLYYRDTFFGPSHPHPLKLFKL